MFIFVIPFLRKPSDWYCDSFLLKRQKNNNQFHIWKQWYEKYRNNFVFLAITHNQLVYNLTWHEITYKQSTACLGLTKKMIDWFMCVNDADSTIYIKSFTLDCLYSILFTLAVVYYNDVKHSPFTLQKRERIESITIYIHTHIWMRYIFHHSNRERYDRYQFCFQNSIFSYKFPFTLFNFFALRCLISILI